MENKRVFPSAKKAVEKRKEKKTVVILKQNGGLFYEKREDQGILASLYGFPLIEGHLSRAKLKERLAKEGLEPTSIKNLKPYIHRFSHVEWDMKAFLIDLPKDHCQKPFLTIEERKKKFALPSAFLPFEEEIEKEFAR